MTIHMPTVESGIPLPKIKRGPKNKPRPFNKYPFHKMSIGESFFIKTKTYRDQCFTIMNIKQSVIRRKKAKKCRIEKHMDFTCRKVVENGHLGIRCWRIK